MVFKLYGSAFSTCTKRVAIVLHEKRVPFEFFPINLATREQKTPSFLEKQPFGVVPYIDDDGFILYESRAISRYIALKYESQGTKLIPTHDLKKIALFEQAVCIEQSSFDPYVTAVGMEKIINPRKGIQTNEATVEAALASLSAKLDVYDVILAKQKYLAGDDVTLADFFHIPWGVLLVVAGSDIMESKPNVARWWKDITSRPSWAAVKDGVNSVASF
ncbi:glutathione S-transferase [Guyanagaster necrorhizus]|uniref:glutathione transferase n=1 Tax=Guyanagaster necrorhizus TaxID=856835 RepID=A0A9P8AXK7_9AGAR|nr:glutathione S-transferase [Guyanagaster necrorhizus MCA 3950]KAG7451460.1 glutathione S-transferase [Guyanagaster necrorhizus MCA 3950]